METIKIIIEGVMLSGWFYLLTMILIMPASPLTKYLKRKHKYIEILDVGNYIGLLGSFIMFLILMWVVF